MKTKQKLKSGLHALVWREDTWFVAKCVEVEVASQGKSKQEALRNVEEALALYFENEKVSAPPSLSNLELTDVTIPASYA